MRKRNFKEKKEGIRDADDFEEEMIRNKRNRKRRKI